MGQSSTVKGQDTARNNYVVTVAPSWMRPGCLLLGLEVNDSLLYISVPKSEAEKIRNLITEQLAVKGKTYDLARRTTRRPNTEPLEHTEI